MPRGLLLCGVALHPNTAAPRFRQCRKRVLSGEAFNARSARRGRSGLFLNRLEVRLGVELVQELLDGDDVGIIRRVGLEGVLQERAHTGARRFIWVTLIGLVQYLGLNALRLEDTRVHFEATSAKN